MNYFEKYDLMYQNGYRPRYSCAGSAFLHYAFEVLGFKSCLDVGCARGEAVEWLSSNKKKKCKAHGVDVAKTVIEEAKSRGLAMTLASATDLPFKDRSFEAVFSSDVLEHLERKDIDQALSEMIRVSSKWTVLQVATKATKARWRSVTGIDQVHLTVMSAPMWYLLISGYAEINITFYGQTKHHALFILTRSNYEKKDADE